MADGTEEFEADELPELGSLFGIPLAGPLIVPDVVIVRVLYNSDGVWGVLGENPDPGHGTVTYKVTGFSVEPRYDCDSLKHCKGPIESQENYEFFQDVQHNRGDRPVHRLKDKNGRTGILIHGGVSHRDSLGCLILGSKVDGHKRPSKILDSATFVPAFFRRYKAGVLGVRDRKGGPLAQPPFAPITSDK